MEYSFIYSMHLVNLNKHKHFFQAYIWDNNQLFAGFTANLLNQQPHFPHVLSDARIIATLVEYKKSSNDLKLFFW